MVVDVAIHVLQIVMGQGAVQERLDDLATEVFVTNSHGDTENSTLGLQSLTLFCGCRRTCIQTPFDDGRNAF